MYAEYPANKSTDKNKFNSEFYEVLMMVPLGNLFLRWLIRKLGISIPVLPYQIGNLTGL